jgi:hypothetical protein
MDLDLLVRLRRSASIFGLVMAAPLATYFGIAQGIAWIAGIAWSLVNLYFITALVKDVITLEDRRVMPIILTLLIKFPVLYAAGFVLLAVAHLPIAWLMAGFTWPFFVLVMKGAGRVWLKLDERQKPAQNV